MTYGLFALTVISALFAATWLPDALGLELARGLNRVVFVLPIAALGGGLSWFVGGYRVRES